MSDKNVKISVGGNIERAIKGEYTIDVKGVLIEAWQKTSRSRMSINMALIGVFFLGILVSSIASGFFGGIEKVFESQESLQMINIIVTVAVWPFIAGVEMMGVLHAINRPTKPKTALAFLSRGSWVVLCALLTALLNVIVMELSLPLGNLFTLLTSSVLAVLLSFTVILVVEKKLSPVQAVILSFRVLRFKIFPLFTVYASLFVALMSSLFPFALLMETAYAPIGIGIFLYVLSYVAPWYFNVKGVLYRDIFGVIISKEVSNSSSDVNEHNNVNPNDPDDTFTA